MKQRDPGTGIPHACVGPDAHGFMGPGNQPNDASFDGIRHEFEPGSGKLPESREKRLDRGRLDSARIRASRARASAGMLAEV